MFCYFAASRTSRFVNLGTCSRTIRLFLIYRMEVMQVSKEMIELWREPRVVQAVGLGRSTVWSLVKKREFPAPVPIHDGGRAIGWPSNEVQAWIENRIAAGRSRAA